MDHVYAETDRELNELGQALYGDKWPQVLAHNTRRMAPDDGQLTLQDKARLIDGLKLLKAKRP